MMIENIAAFANQSLPQTCGGKPIFGLIEKIMLLDKNLLLSAKLDTGSLMTSLSATNITINKIDKKNSMVHFFVYSPATKTKTEFKRPLIGHVYILKRKEEASHLSRNVHTKKYSKRPVISETICIGGTKINILVNLVDRTQFNYPMIIGSDTLNKLRAIVDVSLKHETTPVCQ
jgi:hypothetical protein